MRLPGLGDESNVEDRRGVGGLRGRGAQLGIGGTLVVLALSVLFRQNLFSSLGVSPAGEQAAAPPSEEQAQARRGREEELRRVAVGTFNDAQRVWQDTLAGSATPYRPAKLVLFWDEVRSGCGDAAAEVGPFYCPADEKVYIDLGFFDDLRRRFGAPGDFAQAYVIAHELGHHAQHLLGIERKVRSQMRGERHGPLAIAMELQADCMAGVWGHSTQKRAMLDPGDVEEALGAASAVGDDRLQKAATGRVNPETWTHGSAAQRASWFRRGFESGRIADCDTFGGNLARR